MAALCSPKVHRLHLPTTPLQTQSPLPAPNRNSFAVWRAATTGCAVHAGTIELPEAGLLLLAGRGVHFNGTTFTGPCPHQTGNLHGAKVAERSPISYLCH